MQRVNHSRLSGSLSLAALLVGGVTTNCDVCPAPDFSGLPQIFDVPQPARDMAVDFCMDEQRYRAPSNLAYPEECDATQSQFEPGAEVELRPPVVRRCPDDGQPFRVTDEFIVFWTECNISDRVSDSQVPYQLEISAVQDGVEDPFPLISIPLHAFELERCQCGTQGVPFSGDDFLLPGQYRFRLSSPFSHVGFADVVIFP